MFKSFKWAFLIVLLSANVLSAATYYVSKTGSDSNNGSAGAPWLTIGKAASTASAGDTVNIGTGSYSANVTFSKSGSSGNPIAFIGSGSVVVVGNITISGSYVTLSGITCSPPSAGAYCAVAMNGNYDTFTNSSVANYGAQASDQATMVNMNGNYETIINCVFANMNDIDVLHIWGHDQLISGVLVTNVNEVNYSANHTDFVQTWGSSTYNVVIRNCQVLNSSCQLGNTEMDINGGTWGWTFENCVFRNIDNCYFSGIPNTHFYNCVFDNVGKNQGAPIIWYAMTTSGNQRSSTGSSVENTVFYNCSSMSGNGVSVSSITQIDNYSGSSPGFVNESKGDYHLAAGSPLIGAGANLYSIFTMDLDGNPRPATGTWDIGAYQYSTGGGSPPPSTFTISASAGTGGSISPSGSVSVNSGSSQTFTIAASSGYQISSVAVDGSNVGTVSSYTFTNVTTNHTISASFVSTGVTLPSAPGTLSANPVSPSEIDLSWTASTVGTYAIAGYHIYVNGASTPTASVTGTSYKSTGLSANSAYAYAVAAYDSKGNEGQQSAASATTWPQLSTKFASGQQVSIITGPANVRQQPTNQLAGAVIGQQPANAVGTVVGGPIYAAINGVYYYWWNLSFSTSPSGWVAEDNLQTYTVAPAAIQVTPGSIALGTILSGTGTSGSFTVKNIGGGTLSGTASVGSPFGIVSGGSYNLSANQIQTVTVSFNPTTAGSYSQNVTLTGGGGASVGVSGNATNAPIVLPTVSTISVDATDVDLSLTGLQIYSGTTAHFSATATNAQTWQWSYTVNGGSPVVYTNSTSPITNISYYFGTNAVGNSYAWTLVVSNGQAKAVSQTNLAVEAVPNPGGTVTNIIQGPTISATSGTLSGLLTSSTTINGVSTTYFYQPLFFIGSTTGGTATYNVTITNAGNYEIEALVYAPNANADSFLVNIDGQPQSPTMLWDITPYTSGFEQRVVSWRGNGSQGYDQFVPKLFTLSSGQHQIVFVGSQPGTAMASFTLLQVITTVQSPSPPAAPSGLRIISSSP